MTWVEVEPGVRLRVSDRRPDHEMGDPVLLVHGWKQSHRLFDRLAWALVRRGHRVVSYDHRGMGESDKPDGPYDFEVFAADLGRVVRQLPLVRPTVLGWSMGCTVSLEYLRLQRDHGVHRLILHNGPLRLTQAPGFPHAMPPHQLDSYLADLEQGWPSGERRFLAESLLDGVDDPLVDLLLGVALQTPLDVALKAVRNQAKIDHRAVVESLDIPVLAAYSRHDPYYPISLAQWIADHAPQGSLALLDGSSHCAPLEEPETLAEIVSTFATTGKDPR